MKNYLVAGAAVLALGVASGTSAQTASTSTASTTMTHSTVEKPVVRHVTHKRHHRKPVHHAAPKATIKHSETSSDNGVTKSSSSTDTMTVPK